MILQNKHFSRNIQFNVRVFLNTIRCYEQTIWGIFMNLYLEPHGVTVKYRFNFHPNRSMYSIKIIEANILGS